MATMSYIPTIINKTSTNHFKNDKLKTRLPLPIPHKLRPTPLPKKWHPTSLPLLRPDHRALTERQLSHLVSTIIRLPVGETITPVLSKCQGYVTQSILLQLVQDLGRQGYTLRAAEAAVWAQGQLRVKLDARILAELASALRAAGHVDIATIIHRPFYSNSAICTQSDHENHQTLSIPQVHNLDPVYRVVSSNPSITDTPLVHKAHDSNHVPSSQESIDSMAPSHSPHVSTPSNTFPDGKIREESNRRRVPTNLQPSAQSSLHFLAPKPTLTFLRTPPPNPTSPNFTSDNMASSTSNSPLLDADPSLFAGVQGLGSHSTPRKTEARTADISRNVKPVPATRSSPICETMSGECAYNEVGLSEGGKRERKQSLLEWTSVISSLTKSGQLGEAKVSYWQMLREGGKPDPVLYRLMLQVYAKLEDVDRAEKLLRQMRAVGFMPSLVEYNILISLHCAMRFPQKSVKVLEVMMTEGVAPTTETFNLIIQGFKDAGDYDEAIRILRTMGGRGAKLDSSSYELLLKIHAIQRQFKEFDAVMEEMQMYRFRLRPGAADEIRSLYYEASKSNVFR